MANPEVNDSVSDMAGMPSLSAEQSASLDKLIQNPSDWYSSASGESIRSRVTGTASEEEYEGSIDEDLLQDEESDSDDGSTEGRLSTQGDINFPHEEMTSESHSIEETRNESEKSEEEIEDELYEKEERRLKKIYEENIDGAITEIEKGNFFLGFDKIPEADRYLADKKVMRKFKLNPEPYMESWAKDVFVLQHNTIKTEIRNLYKIVASMEKRGMNLLGETVGQFYEWWAGFVAHFSLLMDVEEEIIFPWIERRADLVTTGLDAEQRTAIRTQIVNVLNTISSQEAKVGYMPPGEIAPKMLLYLNQFCPIVLGYMSRCIYNVVPRLEEAYSMEDCASELLPAIARFYRVNEDWSLVAPLFTTWMDKQQVTYWKRTFLNTKERLGFSLWVRGFRRGHLELQKAIIEERRVRKTLYRTWSK